MEQDQRKHRWKMQEVCTIAQELTRFPSVTPAKGAIFEYLETFLTEAGFTCQRLPFSEPGTAEVENLYAQFGKGNPHFCFAGHVDVVPAGDLNLWTHPPFAASIQEDTLYGRGVADMKGGIAAFLAAAMAYLEGQEGNIPGTISLLITGDEEGPAINGTQKVLRWMEEQKIPISHCLVGEPTNPEFLGQFIKIGRRGSLNCTLTVHGVQGHVAYPNIGHNPIPDLLHLLSALLETPLDQGSANFQPSNLEITSIDVENPTRNVIPGKAKALFNCRFNDHWTSATLGQHLRSLLEEAAQKKEQKINYELVCAGNAEAFLTPPGTFVEQIQQAIQKVSGHKPELSTSGGTSDARFITKFCPVVEYGLTSGSIHKIDEQALLKDLTLLRDTYLELLKTYFSASEST